MLPQHRDIEEYDVQNMDIKTDQISERLDKIYSDKPDEDKMDVEEEKVDEVIHDVKDPQVMYF